MMSSSTPLGRYVEGEINETRRDNMGTLEKITFGILGVTLTLLAISKTGVTAPIPPTTLTTIGISRIIGLSIGGEVRESRDLRQIFQRQSDRKFHRGTTAWIQGICRAAEPPNRRHIHRPRPICQDRRTPGISEDDSGQFAKTVRGRYRLEVGPIICNIKRWMKTLELKE